MVTRKLAATLATGLVTSVMAIAMLVCVGYYFYMPLPALKLL